MKRHISSTIVCLFILPLLSSCFKDNGNYNYKSLVPIEIDDATVPAAIVKKQQEYLVISPSVKQGTNDANLEYEWRLKDNLWMPDPTTGKFIDMVIGTSKDLNFLLDVPTRQYHLLLYVTDKSNGVTEHRQIDLTVQTIAPQGWMVLSGNDTSCDVSIVVNPKVNATLAGFTENSVKHNIFSENNEGRKAEGAPVMVRHGQGGNESYAYIFTKSTSGGYRVSSADLKIVGDYRSNFRNLPAGDVGFEGFGSWSYNELIVNNKDVYYCAQNTNIHVPFGVKCFGLDYEAAPYIGTHQYGYVYGAFYDSKNKRFLYLNYQQDVLAFNAPASGCFDMNNVGKEMVYGEMGYPSDVWYCIMQDDADSGTRKLYVVDLNRSTWDQFSSNGERIIDISGATDMTNSKYFAFGTRGYVMYHATDTKIYYNNYNGDAQSSLIYDIATTYPGYQVSRVDIYKYSGNGAYHSKLLFVGIYNSSTGRGELLQFVVNETNGSLEEPTPEVYSGFGKIASMNYKRI